MALALHLGLSKRTLHEYLKHLMVVGGTWQPLELY